MSKEKDLEYYRKNADEDYITTPISVLKYISYLELSHPFFHDLSKLDSLEDEDNDE